MPKGQREARLRPAYAAWYPTITVASWVSAKTVARTVARQLLDGEPHGAGLPRWAPGQRILDDRHFMFRGGFPQPPETRSRRADHADVSGKPPPPPQPKKKAPEK